MYGMNSGIRDWSLQRSPQRGLNTESPKSMSSTDTAHVVINVTVKVFPA